MSDGCADLLDWLLKQSSGSEVDPVESIRDWKTRYDSNAARWTEPVDRAISGGFLADRTAWAFLAGFFAAMQRLVPEQARNRITAFCISEEGGAHPRAIKTRLEKQDSGDSDWLLNGRKQFITCATDAEAILVAASTGTDLEGRNRIRLAHIDRNAEGVQIEPMPDLPFIPEIRHGFVILDNVAVKDSQILPGDAYTVYIKPFRTIEDVHVSAAILGYLLRCAIRFQWPTTSREAILGFIAAIRSPALADPSSPPVHIALAGIQQSMDRMIKDLDRHWETAPETDRKAWKRDRAVLEIAGKARSARLETAWKAYIGQAGIGFPL